MRRILWGILPPLIIPLSLIACLIFMQIVPSPMQNLNLSKVPSQTALAATFSYEGPLPATVDLREWAPKPATQGQDGSCLSWAAGYTLLGWYAKRAGKPITFAPMYVYSQTHIKNNAMGGGSTPQDTFSLLIEQGIVPRSAYPQGDANFTIKPTKTQRRQAERYRIAGYTELYINPNGNAGSRAKTAIQTVLASGNPVGLSIPVNKKFEQLDKHNYRWDAKDIGDVRDQQGVHYVAIMAYDATGVWIENSWTTNWGRQGYAHLSWDFITQKSYEAEAIHGFAIPVEG